MKILILEDDKRILDTIKDHITESLDHSVIDSCQSIAQAKYFLKRNVYDLISLDLALPDGNGLDLAKEIRESVNNNRAYLFIITGNDSLEIAFKAYDSTRCFKFLRKPFDIEKLSTSLNEFKESILTNPINSYFIHQSKTLDIKIPASEICYFETFYKECTLTTTSSKISLNRYPLKNIIEDTEELDFIQIHKSYVINCNFLKKIEYKDKQWKCFLTHASEELPIGSKFLNSIKERLKMS